MACKEKYGKQNQNMSEKLNTGRNKGKKELFYLEVVGNIYLFIHLFIHSIFFEGFHIPDTGSSKPFTGGKKMGSRIHGAQGLMDSSSFSPLFSLSIWLRTLTYTSFHLVIR